MATLLKTKALYRTVRYHAALDAGHTLSVSGARQEPVEVLLRQSDMDSACAHHCVAMALIILGLVKRSDLPTIWIITEADRSVTTLLLPEDY